VDPAVLAQDIVQGVTVRIYWKDIETAPGVFDWTKLDEHFELAQRLGKSVRLALGPGAYAPDWLTRQENNTGGYDDTCVEEGKHETSTFGVETFCAIVANGEDGDLIKTFPVPWDDVYSRRWRLFLKAVVSHLEEDEGQGLDTLDWIAVTGPNGHNGEVSHPDGDWLGLELPHPVTGSPITTNALLLDALSITWKRTIDEFDQLFGSRGVHYTLAFVLRSFPLGKGNSDHDATFKETLLAHSDVVQYPSAFGLQSNGLDDRYKWSDTGDEVWPDTKDHWRHLRDFAGLGGTLTGMQSRGMKRLYDKNKDGKLSDDEVSACTRGDAWEIMANNVRCLQADFVEVYASDLKVGWDKSCGGGVRRELEELSAWLTR